MNMSEMTFEDDLVFVSDKVTDALNVFNDTIVRDNKLVTVYGNEEFIALFLTPYEDQEGWGNLRLRTRDMAASWDYVPSGFSQIGESRGLLADMRRAAKVSLKRNSIWYIDQQIKDVVGDRVVFTELTTNKGYLYKVGFANGFTAYLSIVRDDKEYNKPHDMAQLFYLSDEKKSQLSAPMIADECILMLVNMAMQTDIRVSKFINIAEQKGGKTVISHSYRTEDESVDEAKAVFANGYAMKLRIRNDELIVELLGKYNSKTYLLDLLKYQDISDVYELVKELSELEQYTPSEEDMD